MLKTFTAVLAALLVAGVVLIAVNSSINDSHEKTVAINNACAAYTTFLQNPEMAVDAISRNPDAYDAGAFATSVTLEKVHHAVASGASDEARDIVRDLYLKTYPALSTCRVSAYLSEHAKSRDATPGLVQPWESGLSRAVTLPPSPAPESFDFEQYNAQRRAMPE